MIDTCWRSCSMPWGQFSALSKKCCGAYKESRRVQSSDSTGRGWDEDRTHWEHLHHGGTHTHSGCNTEALCNSCKMWWRKDSVVLSNCDQTNINRALYPEGGKWVRGSVAKQWLTAKKTRRGAEEGSRWTDTSCGRRLKQNSVDSYADDENIKELNGRLWKLQDSCYLQEMYFKCIGTNMQRQQALQQWCGDSNRQQNRTQDEHSRHESINFTKARAALKS